MNAAEHVQNEVTLKWDFFEMDFEVYLRKIKMYDVNDKIVRMNPGSTTAKYPMLQV